MQKKTEERLEREFLVLPLHHIDTNILLEPENTENGRFCQRYLQKVGSKYRGYVSLPVLGEILMNIFSLKTLHEKYVALDTINSLLSVRKIDFYTPGNIGDYLNKVRGLDSRIESTDAQIFVCGVEHGAKTFVTLDSKLIHNKRLEEEFDIEIKHPSELI